MDNEVSFEFSTSTHEFEIVECGVQILTHDDDDESLFPGSHESEDDDEIERLLTRLKTLVAGSHESEDDDEIERLLTRLKTLVAGSHESEDDDESISDGSYKSCSEQVSGDDDESLSDWSNEVDESRQ
ncbi:unnamed protein product [Thlaspi arvense]|uniref:Uncharacterized protein n=1 Tax=Thlaspi arvense TaxID=13288 RepID=A0AAU9RSP4_THLAR|nr:unnamed protein product [Thlaspi arvense]